MLFPFTRMHSFTPVQADKVQPFKPPTSLSKPPTPLGVQFDSPQHTDADSRPSTKHEQVHLCLSVTKARVHVHVHVCVLWPLGQWMVASAAPGP